MKKIKSSVHWKEESERMDLTSEYMKKHKLFLDFSIICKNYKDLSLNLIHELRRWVDWENIILYHNPLPESFLVDHYYYIPWQKLSKLPNMPYDKIKTYAGHLDWRDVTRYHTFGPSKIDDFYRFLDIPTACQYQNLPSKFIKCHWKAIEPYSYLICQYQRLSVSFMREYKDKLDWSILCEYQNLSCAFMDEMAEAGMFDWYCWILISHNQKLTEKFINKYKDKLSMNDVVKRKDLKLPKIFKNNPDIKFFAFLKRKGM